MSELYTARYNVASQGVGVAQVSSKVVGIVCLLMYPGKREDTGHLATSSPTQT